MSGWVKNSPVKIRPCFVAVYEKIKKIELGIIPKLWRGTKRSWRLEQSARISSCFPTE